MGTDAVSRFVLLLPQAAEAERSSLLTALEDARTQHARLETALTEQVREEGCEEGKGKEEEGIGAGRAKRMCSHMRWVPS